MSQYKYRTEGKTTAKFAEKAQHKLEGTLELAPDIKYKAQNLYVLDGLGSVFDGTYKVQKLTTRISTEGMTVSADVVQVSTSKSAPKTSSTKEETKSLSDITYIVKKGDTLSSISKSQTSSSNNWKEIEQYNHNALVKANKSNSNSKGQWIYPGMEIKIPGNLAKK